MGGLIIRLENDQRATMTVVKWKNADPGQGGAFIRQGDFASAGKSGGPQVFHHLATWSTLWSQMSAT